MDVTADPVGIRDKLTSIDCVLSQAHSTETNGRGVEPKVCGHLYSATAQSGQQRGLPTSFGKPADVQNSGDGCQHRTCKHFSWQCQHQNFVGEHRSPGVGQDVGEAAGSNGDESNGGRMHDSSRMLISRFITLQVRGASPMFGPCAHRSRPAQSGYR